MRNLQFWHSSVNFNDCTINTYYLAENMTWLFMASDIFSVIEKINENIGIVGDSKCLVSKPVVKNQIYIFQNETWQTIDVLRKEDILDVTEPIVYDEVKNFENWIKKLCLNDAEGCILSKDSKEYEFLDLATNRFIELYEEINNCSFMDFPPETRLYKIKDFFSIYTELLLYQPIRDHVDFIEKTRPPMESVISGEFTKFIRNILAHFPFFTTWDEIYVSKQLVNWISEGRTIDRFLKKYQGHKEVQYRFQERATHKWRYPTIKFPQEYNDDKIFLKDIINEKDGILLCAILMFEVVSSQIIYRPEPND